MSTSAAVMRATSMRGRRVLQAAHGGLGTEVVAALRRSPRGQLEQGVCAQRIAVVGILVTAGDGQHAEAQHGRERVDDLCLIASVADTACQRLGEAQGSVPSRAAGRGRRRTRSGRHRRRHSTFLRRTLGRSKGRRLSSVMAGVALSLPRGGRRFGKRIPTQWQRLTLRPPAQYQTRHE